MKKQFLQLYFLTLLFVLSFAFQINAQDYPIHSCIQPENKVELRGFSGYPNKVAEWKSQIIPYSFEAGLEEPLKNSFIEAINTIEGVTNLCFISNRLSAPGITVKKFGSGNYSFVDLNDNSINMASEQPWVFIHEICHLLGMAHEQQRPDRDSFINILWNNIDPNFKYAFDIIPTSNTLKTDVYDYKSIMHYYPTAFSINGLPTIEPKNTLFQSLGGTQLSEHDTAFLNRLYPLHLDCERIRTERPPRAMFEKKLDTRICTYQPIYFQNTTEAGETYRWIALKGNPSSATDLDFSTYFTEKGYHTVVLEASNAYGTTKWTNIIEVAECSDLHLDILKPNPSNEYLDCTFSKVLAPEFEVSILNSSGQLVFKSRYQRDFDGQINWHLDLPNTLANANYFLQIDMYGLRVTKPFILIR
jgi:hypothetical protein